MASRTADLRGARVLLRRWRSSDLPAFALLNADPEVMAYFPAALTRADSDALVACNEAHFATHGFGLWALEVPGQVPFAGLVGLVVPKFQAAFTPCVEIGWHLAREHWGKGYAVEAASVVLRAAFGPLGLCEVVSLTVPDNLRSRRVMDRLGMQHAPREDFDHPLLPPGHRLRRHLLYRLTRDAWGESRAQQPARSVENVASARDSSARSLPSLRGDRLFEPRGTAGSPRSCSRSRRRGTR
jgi:ribosomal-protein-alanine N-acetyltransferase